MALMRSAVGAIVYLLFSNLNATWYDRPPRTTTAAATADDGKLGHKLNDCCRCFGFPDVTCSARIWRCSSIK